MWGNDVFDDALTTHLFNNNVIWLKTRIFSKSTIDYPHGFKVKRLCDYSILVLLIQFLKFTEIYLLVPTVGIKLRNVK